MAYNHFPQQQGLYDPQFEHDACGVGFLCDIKGRKSHEIICQAQEVLKRLAHRGADAGALGEVVGIGSEIAFGPVVAPAFPRDAGDDKLRKYGIS